MNRILLVLLLWVCQIEALEPLTLLQKAKVDSWIVERLGKHFIFLHVLAKEGESLKLEELVVATIPLEGWRQFREKGAPCALSWLIHTIDLQTGKFLTTFSYLDQMEIKISERDNFLASLLSLSFQPIAETERKKVGPPPQPGEVDRRKIWQPKLLFQGEKIGNVAFLAWGAIWPSDGSEISGKKVIIYTAPERGSWPTYLPYWIEVGGFLGQAKMQVIDSGNELY